MLAEKMRSKLLSAPSQAGSSNDEELGSKEEIQDWLLSVGIVSPVTKESAGALYHQQLSRQVLFSCHLLKKCKFFLLIVCICNSGKQDLGRILKNGTPCFWSAFYIVNMLILYLCLNMTG